jgi:hypothetical protein
MSPEPEEREVEAAHFELWEGELPPLPQDTADALWIGFVIDELPKRPSVWVRVGEMAAFLAVWSVILAVGVSFWVVVGAVVWWLVTR